MLKKILTLFAAALIAISAAASRPTVKYDGWTIHPSFDNLPRRIVDTPGKVYFFVHQRPFNKTAFADMDFSQPQYLTPAGAVFTLDKADPSAPMANINNLAPLSGADMVCFEVDPASGTMVFAYNDGGVDVVSKDYKVRYFDMIARRNFPGAAKVRNISFDPDTSSVRVACDSGFIEISTADFSLIRSASWTKPVSDIISAAGQTVAIIDGKVCAAAAGADIIRMDAFTEIPGVASGFLGVPMRVMPLSYNTFGIVTDAGQISFVSYDGNSWAFSEKVKADNSMPLAADVSAANLIEHTVIPNADGFYVSTPSKAYLVKRATSTTSPLVTTIGLPGGSTRWSDSYDGSTFWFYRERGQFLSATYADAKWSALSPAIRPDAPLTTSECLFAYSPGNGMIVSSEAGGGYSICAGVTKRQPALLSLYSNGRWSNIAPVYNLPEAYNTNANLKKAIDANINIWPLCDPTGFAVDPISPNYVHFGSTWGGAAAYDFTDSSKMPLLKLSTKNAFQSFTTQKFPPQTWQDAAVAFCAGCDADNNLWYLCNEQWNKTEYPSATYVSLYYITPEGRKSALESADPSKMVWNRLPVDQGVNSNIYNYALPLKHPKNRGRIFWYTIGVSGTERYAVIYDTAGTLADASDDSLKKFHRFMLPNGSDELFNNVNQAIEDPVTGKLYVLTQFGTYIIDPADKAVGNESFPAEMLAPCDADGNPAEIYSPFICSRGTFDEYGRLWLGTQMGGVVCINPATHRILARYTVDNSPLPTNDIRGIGWNPDTKSLFISTHLGLLEVRPDDAAAPESSSLQRPFLSADTVEAGFTGTVAVHNAPANVNLAVTDNAGRKVATLDPAVKGVAFWDLVSDDGLRVMPGLYYIRDISAGSSFPDLMLIVK